MTDLIEKLERLTGPCRECDAEIHTFFNPDDKITIHRYDDTGEIAFIEVTYPNGESELDEILSYTYSVDAALTLIPENMVPSIGTYKSRPWPYMVNINGTGDDNDRGKSYGQGENKSLPIAISIAALRAHEQKETS